MSTEQQTVKFFNRPHAVEGAQALATFFTAFAAVFAPQDYLKSGSVGGIATAFCFAAVALSIVASVAGRRLGSGLRPLLVGLLIGFFFWVVVFIRVSIIR